MESDTYGPVRPPENHDYENFRTPVYLRGHAGKILKDLSRWARLYNGRLIRLFFPSQGERCLTCTNLITGERMLSSCPECHGTGFKKGWTFVGKFWCFVDFGPTYAISSENGNVENPGGIKDAVTVLGAPPIHDQSLLIFEETRQVYKVYNVEPHKVALLGSVITQICQGSYLSYGQSEYSLIDW